MSKITTELLEKVKENFTSVLDLTVIEEVENHGEEWQLKLGDIVQRGCVSGTVSSLIYYSDTIAYHDKYEDEINDLISEIVENTGISFNELVNDKFEIYEIDQLKNFKAWLAFEETAYRIQSFVEEIE